MGKAPLLGLILLLFAGFTDDVCALCLSAMPADGAGAIADGLSSTPQIRTTANRAGPPNVRPPDADQCLDAFCPNCLAPDRIITRLAAIDPVYGFMSIQR